MKFQVTRSRERLDWYFTRSKKRLELNGNVFHCFNEVETLKELSSRPNSFFNEVDIEDELSLGELVSFFKELDTRKMNATPETLFHCLRSLTQENELCSGELVSFFKELDTRKRTLLRRAFITSNKKSWNPRGSHLMGEKHLGIYDFLFIMIKVLRSIVLFLVSSSSKKETSSSEQSSFFLCQAP